MSEYECELRMLQNESLHLAVDPNMNVLSDGKSLHTQGHRRVSHALPKVNNTGPLITFVIRIRRSYSQVES